MQLVLLSAFVLVGYNQSGVGGLLPPPDWNEHFPESDTLDAAGAKKSHKPTIRGAVVAIHVHNRCAFRRTLLLLGWRLARKAKDRLRCCDIDVRRRSFTLHQPSTPGSSLSADSSWLGYGCIERDSSNVAAGTLVRCQPWETCCARWILYQSGLIARGLGSSLLKLTVRRCNGAYLWPFPF
jgi:hypothetical protein